jgi:hypothetical protein
MQEHTMLRKMNFVVVGILVGLGCVLFLLLHSTAHASFCSAREDDLQAAEVIFSGKVLNIAQKQGDDVITFQVLSAWKGAADTQSEAVVYTGNTARDCGMAPCGYRFMLGQRYLVFAYKWPAIPHFDMGGSMTIPAGVPALLMTDICSRTALLSAAQSDLAALGPGSLPATGGRPTDGIGSWPAYLGVALALIAVGAEMPRLLDRLKKRA